MSALFSKAGRMSALVNQFQTSDEPHGTEIAKTTVQIGAGRYRQCSRLFFNPDDFFLAIRFVFKRYPLIFIPWSMIKECRSSSLFGRKAVQLELAGPELPYIRIYENDFKQNQFYQRDKV
jgi:hypothetical protein